MSEPTKLVQLRLPVKLWAEIKYHTAMVGERSESKIAAKALEEYLANHAKEVR